MWQIRQCLVKLVHRSNVHSPFLGQNKTHAHTQPQEDESINPIMYPKGIEVKLFGKQQQ